MCSKTLSKNGKSLSSFPNFIVKKKKKVQIQSIYKIQYIWNKDIIIWGPISARKSTSYLIFNFEVVTQYYSRMWLRITVQHFPRHISPDLHCTGISEVMRTYKHINTAPHSTTGMPSKRTLLETRQWKKRL